MRSLLYPLLGIPVLLAGCQSDNNRYPTQQVVAEDVGTDYTNISEEPGTAFISRNNGDSECATPHARKDCVSSAPRKTCIDARKENVEPKKINRGDSDVSWNDDDPLYGHARNYSWLIGNLQKVHVTGATWKIRYARLDEEDRFGGTAILTPDSRIDRFQDGDFVYVEGHILNDRPSVYLAGPSYRIRTIRKVTESDRRKLWTAKKKTDTTIK